MFVSASNEVLKQKRTWVVDGINGYMPNKRVVTWPPTPLPQLPFISPPVQYDEGAQEDERAQEEEGAQEGEGDQEEEG